MTAETTLSAEQMQIINDMILAWIDDPRRYRTAFREDCKRLLSTVQAPALSSQDRKATP